MLWGAGSRGAELARPWGGICALQLVASELSGCAQCDWSSVLCSVTLISVTVDTQRRLGHHTDQWESRRNRGRGSHRRESKERGTQGAPRGVKRLKRRFGVSAGLCPAGVQGRRRRTHLLWRVYV